MLVMGRSGPEALLLHLGESLLAEPSVRLALATALYKDECASLGRAAALSGLALADFMEHVSQLGIPVVRGSSTLDEDRKAIEAWL